MRIVPFHKRFGQKAERSPARRRHLDLILGIMVCRRVQPERAIELQRCAHVGNNDINGMRNDGHDGFPC